MNKEFIPYEQALELKELGFDEPCMAFYEPNNKEVMVVGVPQRYNDPLLLRLKDFCAPLYQQVFRWFREKHNLHSEILLDQTSQPKYCFEIHKYEDFGNYEEIRIGEWFLYRTPEEAELECIKHLIKVVGGY